MATPEVEYVEHDGRKQTGGALVNRIQSIIEYRETISANNVIDAMGGDLSNGQGCTIMYHTGDKQRKRRTLEPGQTFNFANDIREIHFGVEVTDLAAYEKMFTYMDTTGTFWVSKDLFGNSEQVKDAELLIEYTRPDDRVRRLRERQGKYYNFDASQGEPIKPPPKKRPQPGPNPPKPVPIKSCLCPCPQCAKGHLTDEQRKQQEEQQKKQEQERQAQLEDLKESIKRAHELARNAATTAEQANNLANETKSDVQNIYRELADIRAILSTIADDRGRKWEIPPLFKVCMVSSQILALVVLGEYTWRAIIQGKRA